MVISSCKALGSPSVSIGLPVFNGDNYIAQSIDSILAQSYSDFELIICDNASTDNTQRIIKDYAAADARIRVFNSDTNYGAAWNYNRTVDLARGKYFRWQSHDDVIAPDALERCVDVLEKQSDAVLCYPSTILIDSEGSVIGPYHDRLQLVQNCAFQRFSSMLRMLSECNAVFGLIRLANLEKTARIGNYIASDRVLLGELALHGKFIEVHEPHFYRRDHPLASRRSCMTDEQLDMWFDSKKAHPVVMKNVQLTMGYAAAILRAPITTIERFKCFAYLARDFFRSRDIVFQELRRAAMGFFRRRF